MSSSKKPHPLNNDLLIIYFIGGVTTYEYKLVKEIFGKEKDHNVNYSFFLILKNF